MRHFSGLIRKPIHSTPRGATKKIKRKFEPPTFYLAKYPSIQSYNMELLSDISSVSSHGSMPPLMDLFGRIVFNEDRMPPLIDRFGNLIFNEDQETITMMDTESVSTSPIMGWTYEAREYDATDFQFYRPPPIEIPQNTHLYFDDDGEEISREQFLMKEDSKKRQQSKEEDEDDHEFGIRTPKISHKFTMRHPRVLLNFLRFIDTYNEVAEADELFMLPAIPKKVYDSILTHVSLTNTAPEFEKDVKELKLRLERHMDLSELPVN
jgi:hypothetical protein